MDQSPNISSFVIRFIHGETIGEGRGFRGTIRHVQSNQEISFNRWEEAERFIQTFVPIKEPETSRDTPEPPEKTWESP